MIITEWKIRTFLLEFLLKLTSAKPECFETASKHQHFEHEACISYSIEPKTNETKIEGLKYLFTPRSAITNISKWRCHRQKNCCLWVSTVCPRSLVYFFTIVIMCKKRGKQDCQISNALQGKVLCTVLKVTVFFSLQNSTKFLRLILYVQVVLTQCLQLRRIKDTSNWNVFF